MGFCTVEDVKLRLGLSPEETAYDEELSALVEEASEVAAAILGESWPSPEEAPRLVRYATANIAAGIFRRLRGTPGEGEPLYRLGLEELEFYKRSRGAVRA